MLLNCFFFITESRYLQARMSVIGVPVKVLHEAEGHIVTVETTTGEVYRGKLIEAEDNMNSQVGRRELDIVCSLSNLYL